jgi:hypothetical protein
MPCSHMLDTTPSCAQQHDAVHRLTTQDPPACPSLLHPSFPVLSLAPSRTTCCRWCSSIPTTPHTTPPHLHWLNKDSGSAALLDHCCR